MKLRDIFNTLVEMLDNAPVELPNWRTTDVSEEMAETLRKWGFTFLGAGAYSVSFKSEQWGGVVLKMAYTACGVNYPKLDENPQLRQFWLKPLFKSRFVCVQPLADVSDADEVLEEIYEALDIQREELYETHYDIHDENVGRWRGRPVAFDMM